MDYKKYINEDNNTITDLSEFICDNGVSEYQVMIHITQPNLSRTTRRYIKYFHQLTDR